MNPTCPYCKEKLSGQEKTNLNCYGCGIKWSGKEVFTTVCKGWDLIWQGWTKVPEGSLMVRKEYHE